MIEEIKKLLGKEKLILGREETMKALKRGKLEKIFYASNTDEQTKKDLEYYAKISGVERAQLAETNEELGVACKKPFSISIIGVLK